MQGFFFVKKKKEKKTHFSKIKCNQDSFILMSFAKTKNYNLGQQKKANNTTVLNFEIIGLTLEPQK